MSVTIRNKATIKGKVTISQSASSGITNIVVGASNTPDTMVGYVNDLTGTVDGTATPDMLDGNQIGMIATDVAGGDTTFIIAVVGEHPIDYIKTVDFDSGLGVFDTADGNRFYNPTNPPGTGITTWTRVITGLANVYTDSTTYNVTVTQ